MGRLHHLIQTFPSNIGLLNSHNCEFLILNYASKDGMHGWATKNLKPWIDKGFVKYLRTEKPEYFSATHAKNIAHKHATGDIICNLDADNFLVDGFIEYLLEIFQQDIVMVSPSRDISDIDGSCGKIAIKKQHFYSVNGYDEDQNMGWGCDDTNFQFRVKMQNNLEYVYSPKKFSRVIRHSNEERVQNFPIKDIELTKKQSIERLELIAVNKDYIANKNKIWGYIEDLSINKL
jgi:hypothetical protein